MGIPSVLPSVMMLITPTTCFASMVGCIGEYVNGYAPMQHKAGKHEFQALLTYLDHWLYRRLRNYPDELEVRFSLAESGLLVTSAGARRRRSSKKI